MKQPIKIINATARPQKQNSVPFWKFTNSADTDEPAQLVLYGDISQSSWWGDEVTPKQFDEDLSALGDISALDVRINSGGGDVFAAFAIYNRLITLRKNGVAVRAIIDGWAASAATVIAMAAESIEIPAAACFMVHNPSVCLWGGYNSDDLEKLQGELFVVKSAIAEAYAKKTNKSIEDISAIMDAETWYDGKTAVESGFCDKLFGLDDMKVENCNGRVFVNSVEFGEYSSKIPRNVLNCSSLNENEGSGNIINSTTNKEEDKAMNENELRAKYPDVVKAIEDAATKAERERIKNIEENSYDGYEDLVQDAKYDNPISGDALAVKILAAMKKEGAEVIKNRQADALAAGVQDVGSVHVPAGGDSDEKQFEDDLDAVFNA
ncbi:MAG: Clp protease ClpP [Ruminococcaceae bacterium]|nr:Clp protease ClpP [Oscillospiraceae bacterium]